MSSPTLAPDSNPAAEPFFANLGWQFDSRDNVWIFEHGRTHALYDPRTRVLTLWRTSPAGVARWIRRADDPLPLPWEPTYAAPGSKAKRRAMTQRVLLLMPATLPTDYGLLPAGLGYQAFRGRNGAAGAGDLLSARRAG